MWILAAILPATMLANALAWASTSARGPGRTLAAAPIALVAASEVPSLLTTVATAQPTSALLTTPAAPSPTLAPSTAPPSLTTPPNLPAAPATVAVSSPTPRLPPPTDTPVVQDTPTSGQADGAITADATAARAQVRTILLGSVDGTERAFAAEKASIGRVPYRDAAARGKAAKTDPRSPAARLIAAADAWRKAPALEHDGYANDAVSNAMRDRRMLVPQGGCLHNWEEDMQHADQDFREWFDAAVIWQGGVVAIEGAMADSERLFRADLARARHDVDVITGDQAP